MIAIANYGLGNVRAFANIYHRLNIPFTIAETPEQLMKSDRVILPGVGSFDYAMGLLDRSGLRPCLEEIALVKKRPVLGICVGMQMLADSSEEGTAAGLGWIPGKVLKIRNQESKPRSLPLPHMGWNSIEIDRPSPLMAELAGDARFYFLHSYYFECESADNLIASATYGPRFACLVGKENIYGIQCHPEKSHANGVRLLQNFAGL
jgi:glutamine amidotransferase